MTSSELHFPWGDYFVQVKDLSDTDNPQQVGKFAVARVNQKQILVGILIQNTSKSGDQENIPAIALKAIIIVLESHRSTNTAALLEEALISANTVIYHGNQYFNRQDRLSITLIAIDHNRMYLAGAGALGVEWIQPDGRRLQITNPSPEKAPVGSSSVISIDTGFYLPGNENNPEKARLYGQKGLPVNQNESIVLGFYGDTGDLHTRVLQSALILSRKRLEEPVPTEKKPHSPDKNAVAQNIIGAASINKEKDPPSPLYDKNTGVLVDEVPSRQERIIQEEHSKENREADRFAHQKASQSLSTGGRTETSISKPDQQASENAGKISTPRSRQYLKILISIILFGIGLAGIRILRPAASAGPARPPTVIATMRTEPTLAISASPTFSLAAHVDSQVGTGFGTFIGKDGLTGYLHNGDSIVDGTSIYSDQSSLHISLAKSGIVNYLDIFPASSLTLFFNQQDSRVVMGEGAILINNKQGNFEVSLTDEALAIFQVQNGIMLVEKRTESKWAASCLVGTCRFILPSLESWLVIPVGQQQTIIPGSSLHIPSTAVQLTDLIQLDQVCSGCLAVLLPQITPDEWSVDSLGPTIQKSATSTPGKTLFPIGTPIPTISYPTSTNKPPTVPTATNTSYLINTPTAYLTNTPVSTQEKAKTPTSTPEPTQAWTKTPTSPTSTPEPTQTWTKTPTSPTSTPEPTQTWTKTPTSPTSTPKPTQAWTKTPTSPPEPTQPPTSTPAHSSQFSSAQIAGNPVDWYQSVIQWLYTTILNVN